VLPEVSRWCTGYNGYLEFRRARIQLLKTGPIRPVTWQQQPILGFITISLVFDENFQ
jgi:hypothetical protein